MRSQHRIEPFLKKVDIDKLISIIDNDQENKLTINEANELSNSVKDYLSKNTEFWKNNYDLRFGQLLFNAGFNYFDSIYTLEEPEILMMCGYDDVESYGWVSLLNSEGELLEKPVFRFFNELDTDHLKKMMEEADKGVRYYSIDTINLFEKVLESRGLDIKLSPKGKEIQYLLLAKHFSKLLF